MEIKWSNTDSEITLYRSARTIKDCVTEEIDFGSFKAKIYGEVDMRYDSISMFVCVSGGLCQSWWDKWITVKYDCVLSEVRRVLEICKDDSKKYKCGDVNKKVLDWDIDNERMFWSEIYKMFEFLYVESIAKHDGMRWFDDWAKTQEGQIEMEKRRFITE